MKPLPHTNGVDKTHATNGYSGKPITEVITNGFFTVDQEWKVKYWNKAAEKLLKVSARDIVGKNLWEEFAEAIPLEFYKIYHKAFLKDIPVHFEEYWGEMGAWFDVITYYCDNTLSVSFKSINHPTFQESPEHRLKILNELYRYVTEITNDCLWEWDLHAKELFWIDGGHKRVFGYLVENALIPQTFWESRIHPEDKLRVLASLANTITEGSAVLWEADYRFAKADGQYLFVHDRGHIIYDEEGTAARMIGATQDITKRVLLEKKLVEERRARQLEITDAVLTAQENERSDIGKEMHDNLNQVLGATKLYIEMAKKDAANRAIHLEKATGYIVNVMEEIRKISKRLLPPGMRVMGLFDSIETLLDDLLLTQNVKIEFHHEGIDKADLNKKLQLHIFRIVQEQINNILKHAQATHVRIHLSRHADEITLLISDNGKGCDTSEKRKGVGIRNIMGRAEIYHGHVTIVSKPGKGYELKVVLPLKGDH